MWFPKASHDMWCCSSWCWVSSQCPDAQASSIWPGHNYSSLTCDWNVSAVLNCKYSNACACIGSNTGVNTTKLGASYGKSCAAWDAADCAGYWGNTSYWSNDSRNDWCCEQWCYVNETCPLTDESSLASNMKYSYEVCAETPAAAYKESTNTCETRGSCECFGAAAVNVEWQPFTTYGETCALHDVAAGAPYCGGRGIGCCLPWCYVSETCAESVPHPNFTGAFISYAACKSAVVDAELVRCAHSDVCRCQGSNAGLGSRLPATYGLQCSQHDAAKCYEWWGPESGSGLWNTSGENNWCCDSWCYVKPGCPNADGVGEAGLHYSYKACQGTGDVWDAAEMRCRAGSRRLAEEDLCEGFFLLDGRSPAELPETFGEAREATTAMCLDEGFEPPACGEAAEIAFEGFPTGDAPLEGAQPLCARLLVLGAAAGASQDALSTAAQHARRAPPLELAARVRRALRSRAGQEEEVGGAALDETLFLKIESWGASGVGRAVAAGRRLKSDTSDEDGIVLWGSRRSSPAAAPVPVARRRTPQRPSGVATRRRGVEAATSATGKTIARRRTSQYSTHRRRSEDIDGKSRATGGGTRYGYTSRSHISSNFGGRVPAHAPYGYSAGGVYQRDHRPSVAMYALGGAAVGAVAGAGAYHLYHKNNFGIGAGSWRRRRAGPASWCIAPASSGVDMMECSDCFARYGSCESASSCYEQGSTGCGISTRRSYGRDDLIETGFVPGKYKMPLTLTINDVSGADVKASDVCPPTDPAAAELAENFGRVAGFRLDLFVTLTRMEELDGEAQPPPACVLNTEYPCKGGAAIGAAGMEACYGEDEVCSEDQGERMCFCKPGFCLDTSSANGLCQPEAVAIGGASVAVRLAPSLLALVAAPGAAFFVR